MAIEIAEIIGRSEQGVTRPFICRGVNGSTYFVKGRGAGRRSQICELVASKLAVRFGLPVAPFEIVSVPNELVEIGFPEDVADLGAGPAFGSCGRRLVELNSSQKESVSDELQDDVLAFDWWVHNGDRTLTELGGNPNLFWDVESQSLLVLDHNQAFDPTFTASEFFSSHAFHGRARRLFSNWLARSELESRFDLVLADWGQIIASVPSEWLFVDDEQTVPTNFDSTQTYNLLTRFRTDPEFWSAP